MHIGLTDDQLEMLAQAATVVPREKRAIFLERFSAALNLGGHITHDAVARAIAAALPGLLQRSGGDDLGFVETLSGGR